MLKQIFIYRKSLLNLCHCAETYICLRSKFITSFSVLSICHWLLGIGDRHLDNTIVSTKTGFCIGNIILGIKLI